MGAMATQPDDPYPEIINSTDRRKTTSFGTLLIRFLSIYWRSFVIVLWPLILLPIIIVETTQVIAMRCLYVISLMALFWMTEVVPLPITGLIPVVAYPLMGIMSTGDTCACYMNDTTMMFVGSIVIAIAIENSGIHMRVALLIIKTIGCSHRRRFPNSSGISLTSWMLYSVPPMVLMGLLTWLWLQIMYMGMFRPGSKDARAIDIGAQGEKVAETVIKKRYMELGPITWHESCVGVLFVTVVLLWFFRNPGFVRGWPSYITDLHVKDSTAAACVAILFFALPAKLDFLRSFDADPANRPTKPSPGMITWKMIHQKMHWSLIFVLGGGFAISAGSTSSNLSSIVGNALIALQSIDPFAILVIVCLFAETVTELTSNVAVANIILPVLAEICIAIKLHPLYLMVPATICCSFSFHLPVGTPPNAIATTAAHMKTRDIAIAGIGPSVITILVTTVAFSTWGTYVFNLSEFPDWAT
ncbi:protein I'm not dead yet-like isoform X4 [Colletes latitarsis]|uniref:protein I'm not dead yet-like isoform X4 n=1 Tax=Colletes latitarsis TaxID=2605962 RepID=UPI0040373D19